MECKGFGLLTGRYMRLYLNPKEDSKQDETYVDHIRGLRFLEYSSDGYVDGCVFFVGKENGELYFTTEKYGNIVVPIDKVISIEELKRE